MHLFHSSGPFIVHCSAGIGRSGVLMAVDTALARIENGQEVSGLQVHFGRGLVTDYQSVMSLGVG